MVTPKPATYTSRSSKLSLACDWVGRFMERIFVENATACGSRIMATSFVLKFSLYWGCTRNCGVFIETNGCENVIDPRSTWIDTAFRRHEAAVRRNTFDISAAPQNDWCSEFAMVILSDACHGNWKFTANDPSTMRLSIFFAYKDIETKTQSGNGAAENFQFIHYLNGDGYQNCHQTQNHALIHDWNLLE